MSAIALKGLVKVYADGTRALDKIDLEIDDGEFLVLVGPSGCGKTTALRIIAGLDNATEGTVLIDDEPVDDLPPRDRNVAMVFQSYALYPHLDVFDNLAFGLGIRKVPKPGIRQRVRRVADALALTDYLFRRPATLSGGQRQRVAMGRAIAREPRAFLMDEPLSHLDAKLRVQVRAQIARTQRDLGVTTVYVTHDQTEAMTLGERVVVLRDGVQQQVAPPQELYDRPANLFVAEFVGTPTMNVIEGTIEAVPDNGDRLVLGDQRLRLPESVLHQRPALRRYVGQRVLVGIRPEDMEDAAIAGAPEGALLHSVADLVEAVGSDVFVHFPLKGSPVTAPLPVLVGRFSPRTTIFEGQPVTVRVDTTRLHFFDPESRETIRAD